MDAVYRPGHLDRKSNFGQSKVEEVTLRRRIVHAPTVQLGKDLRGTK